MLPAVRRAFTLIELLIVVGIIAILAGIAVVNFLDAQVRSKVAAVKNDLRVFAGSLEAYAVDHNAYPPSKGVGDRASSSYVLPVTLRFIPITTPVAYLTSIPKDRFIPNDGWGYDPTWSDGYDYFDAEAAPAYGSGLTSGGAWRVCSAGPDLYQANAGMAMTHSTYPSALGVDYDPTNGTVSAGDLVRVGPLHSNHGDPTDSSNPNRPGVLRVPSYREQFR